MDRIAQLEAQLEQTQLELRDLRAKDEDPLGVLFAEVGKLVDGLGELVEIAGDLAQTALEARE